MNKSKKIIGMALSACLCVSMEVIIKQKHQKVIQRQKIQKQKKQW